ncbi:unnamed protein product, partial [Sphagnum jensenii]
FSKTNSSACGANSVRSSSEALSSLRGKRKRRAYRRLRPREAERFCRSRSLSRRKRKR